MGHDLMYVLHELNYPASDTPFALLWMGHPISNDSCIFDIWPLIRAPAGEHGGPSGLWALIPGYQTVSSVLQGPPVPKSGKQAHLAVYAAFTSMVFTFNSQCQIDHLCLSTVAS